MNLTESEQKRRTAAPFPAAYRSCDTSSYSLRGISYRAQLSKQQPTTAGTLRKHPGAATKWQNLVPLSAPPRLKLWSRRRMRQGHSSPSGQRQAIDRRPVFQSRTASLRATPTQGKHLFQPSSPKGEYYDVDINPNNCQGTSGSGDI